MSCSIFYGSTTGNTKTVAKLIQGELKNGGIECEIQDIANCESGADLERYDFLVLGSSTWGDGDLQDDWVDFLAKAKNVNLNGKTVAIFGLGDQEGYSDAFISGIKEIYDFAKDAGATLIGEWDSSAYDFDHSEAVIDGKFLGLAIDEDNESDLTQARVQEWCSSIVMALKR